MSKLIPKNTSIPLKKSQIFTTFQDNQPAVTIKVYEGESQMTEDCTLIGIFTLSEIPPAPKGVPKIEIEFVIDADGILKISAQDQGTGNKKEIVIVNESGRLGKSEIQRMAAEAQNFKKIDKAAKDAAEARNGFECFVINLKNTLDEKGIKDCVNDGNRLMVWDAVDNATKWIEENAYAAAEEYRAKQIEIEEIVKSAL